MADTIVPTFRQRLGMAVRAITTHAFPTDPSSFAGRFLGGIIPAGGQALPRGTADYLRAYSHMPWLRAVVARVGYDVGATQWRMFVAVDSQGAKVRNRMLQRAYAPQRDVLLEEAKASGDIEEISDHPLLSMLASANPVQTGLAARKVTQIHLDLVGDAFWLLERDQLGMPVAYWPVPPSWVLGTPTPLVPHYRFSFRGWQGTVPVSEVIWFCDPDPVNPYGRGSGTAQALGDELETDEYASKHVKNFYLNRARPDLIVWPKGSEGLREEQVERLEEQWTARSGGFWRAFKPFFLGREVEVKELSMNFQNQQMVELRKFERDTIMQVYGVSPEVLGVVIGSNRATAMMSEAIYQRRVLVPRLELMRAVMQERLVPLYDERIILNYQSPVVRDAELELQAAEKMPGALEIDEWRQLAGFRPLSNGRGKVHIGPMTWGEVAELREDKLLTPLPENGDGEDVDEELEGEGDGEEDELDEAEQEANTGALMRKAAKALRAGGDQLSAHQAEQIAKTSSDVPASTRVADKYVDEYWRAQETAWSQMAATIGTSSIQAALRNPDGDEAGKIAGSASHALSAVLNAKGRPVFIAGAELALQGLPMRGAQRAPVTISLTDVAPHASAWAAKEAAKLVTHTNAETRKVLRELVAMATDEGLTVDQVARAIHRHRLIGLLPRQAAALRKYRKRLVRDGLSDETITRRLSRFAEAQLRLRAMTIARTEMLTAVNAGKQAMWELAVESGQLPKNVERVWIVTLDDALCTHICEPLTDAVAPLNEPFPGGYMYPPAHPRCRCAVEIKNVPDGATLR